MILCPLIFVICVSSSKFAISPVQVFSKEEIKNCGRIRIPELVKTPSRIILFAQCRVAGYERLVKEKGKGAFNESIYGDDQHLCKLITKSSKDNGQTWENYTVMTPEKGYSHAGVVYDKIREQVLFQYQHHPNVLPSTNTTYYQRFSKDDGLSWSQREDITSKLSRCNPEAPNKMKSGSAGSKLQTEEGRMIFAGHTTAVDHTACVWSTNDGGKTYDTTDPFDGDEISIAEVSASSKLVLFNGKHGNFPWQNSRTNYYSNDGGLTVGKPEKCGLKDINCEGCLMSIPHPKHLTSEYNVLFFSEPLDDGRETLTVHCSFDGGKTWPHKVVVPETHKKRAAYSAMLPINDNTEIMVVWENSIDGFYSSTIGTEWCFGKGK